MTSRPIDICVTGDVHGHMQLALLMAARWQAELRTKFGAVLLCGDIASFSEEQRLDRATRRHGEENPCELEMLFQWMRDPPAAWLDPLFEPVDAGGLGLDCPVIAVHGNHEDFELLGRLAPPDEPIPPTAIPAEELPRLDPGCRISYLPSGWRTVLPSGATVAAIGGIQPGQRPKAGYPPMAYLSEQAVLSLCYGEGVDVLITHQGPAKVQGLSRGAADLDPVLDAGLARIWCHGHSVAKNDVVEVGATTVVPLNGVPFTARGQEAGHPGKDAWCWLRYDDAGATIVRQRPGFWREFDQRRWIRRPDGQLVAPALSARAHTAT